MKKRIATWVVMASALLFCMEGAPSVYAQEDESEDVFILEEITVTAEKRSENLQKVPVAIEAVTGATLAETGKTDFYDALSGITSLHMQEGTRGFIVSLRGMSDDQGGQNSPVTVNVDGDYTRRQEVGLSGLLDIDRIEVLNGPQGTLYGRASSAGVVNVISKNPTDKFEASGLVEFGSYNLQHTDGVLNVPLNEELALRAAYRSVIRDGYMSNGENDQDEQSARLKAAYNPNEDVELVLTFENQRTGGRGTGFVAPFGDDQPDNPWTASYDEENTFRDTNMYRYVADLNWDLGFGVLTFHPSYRDFELDVKWVLMGNLQSRHETTEEFATELRLASPSESKIEWMAGLYYYDKDDYTFTHVEASGAEMVSEDTGESKAIFASAAYPLTDQLRINGGVRYTEDEQESNSVRGGAVMPPSTLDFDNTDIKIGFEYELAGNAMVWGDFSTGYRAGSTRSEPEDVNSYQLGSKNRFLDNRLQLNLSAFYYDYQNYQSEKIVTFDDGTFDMGAGSGDAEIYGVDMQSNYILTKQDRVDFSLSYLNATYKNVTVVYEVADTEYFDGAHKTHSPEWTVALGYEHSFYLPNDGSLKARIDTRYETKQYITFALDPMFDLDESVNIDPAHSISNASLVYGAPSGKYTISAYVKNIEDYATKGHILGNTMRIGSPRTYGLQLSVKYQ
jgi:iron complex outermembrane receptor protein